MAKENVKKKGIFDSFLNSIEVVGNKLPHPVTIFLILVGIVVVVSEIVARTGEPITYYDAKAKKDVTVQVISLLNAEGIRFMFNSAVNNFTTYAPLGTVLFAMLGVGLAEEVGLINAVLKKVVLSTPKRFITAVVVLMGVMSNIAADAGYIVLVPLGAIVFLSFGRHPIAGLAAAFAGVSGGFSANLLIGTLDPLLAGITNEAIKVGGSDLTIQPTANYYFLFVSTFLLTIVGTIVTERIIEPRLGEYKGTHTTDSMDLSTEEKKGLRAAGLAMLVFIIVMAFLTIPPDAIMKTAKEEGAVKTLNEYMHAGFIPTITLFFLLPAIAFGVAAGKIKNDKDVVKGVSKAMNTMGSFLVLAVTSSQFINLFNYTKLGTLLAINGANFLESVGFTGFPLILAFIIVSAFINLFIGSASAKWAIMAPVFIPMLMRLGISPAFAQLAYRIGDSSTNIISPLMTYFAVIITFAQKYDEDAGIGTLISSMIPYSIAFLVSWTALLGVWYVIGLPIGPGAFIGM